MSHMHPYRASEQAGAGFNFECSHQQGAVLILGDVAYRQDALDKRRFAEYIVRRHRSWLAFANKLGRDLSLTDLILVTGCDRTSEWACAAWSEKTKSARLSFIAGIPGVAQGNLSLWGRWESSHSLDKNVGPYRSLTGTRHSTQTLTLSNTLSEESPSFPMAAREDD